MIRLKAPAVSAGHDSQEASHAATIRLSAVQYPGLMLRGPEGGDLDAEGDWISHQPRICIGSCGIVSQADTFTLFSIPGSPRSPFPTDASHARGTATGAPADFDLIRQVQAYLICRAEGSVPGAGLCQAWDRFYSRYSPMVHGIVAGWRMPIDDTEDCIQEVWGEIIRKLPSFDCDPRLGAFQGWFSLVVRRKMIQFNRRKADKRFDHFDDVSIPLVSREPDPADACLSREKRRHVRQMLTALGKTQSERSCQVLYYRSISDLNAKGIANLLQLTPEQVRARYHRMKQKARELLRSQFGESSYRG